MSTVYFEAGSLSNGAVGSYHHGRLREALLEAALELAQERGPRALSLRELARRAGVSPAAPYRHFPDLQSLLAALATEGFVELGEALGRVEPADDPLERLRRIGIAYVGYAASAPMRFRIMFGDSVEDRRAHPELDAAARAAFEHLRRAVAAAVAEGRVRGDPRALVLLSWSVVHGLSALLVDGQLGALGIDERSAVEVADVITALLTGGIAP